MVMQNAVYLLLSLSFIFLLFQSYDIRLRPKITAFSVNESVIIIIRNQKTLLLVESDFSSVKKIHNLSIHPPSAVLDHMFGKMHNCIMTSENDHW